MIKILTFSQKYIKNKYYILIFMHFCKYVNMIMPSQTILLGYISQSVIIIKQTFLK